MPVLLTIGHEEFIVRNMNAAMAAIKALDGALPVEWDYNRERREPGKVYKQKERKVEIKVELIDAAQIHIPKPQRKPQNVRLLEDRQEPPFNLG